jgi:hypothetical protein
MSLPAFRLWSLEFDASSQPDELRADIRASARRIVRHWYAALLVQSVVLVGIAYFYVTHLEH